MEFIFCCIERKIRQLKSLFYLSLIFLFAGCNKKEKQIKPITKQQTTTIPAALNYDSCKKEILLLKQKNKAGWDKLTKKQKEKIFTAAVAQTIMPNWIGTAWDYNGVSQTPQKESIACGYFVTTTLRDAGLNIARVKLAQCASEQMIRSLIQLKYIQRFSNVPMVSFIQSIQQQGYGLYIVGLDNHTGFIYNDGKEIYFIHSTFVGKKNVQKEKAAVSVVLNQSKYKVIGKISADEIILDKWIN